MSVWDNPDLQPPTEDYVRLDNVGDGFVGQVTKVMAQHFDDGTVAPQLTFIDEGDGEERSWTAGQIMSKKRLAELRPEPGDRISVRLTEIIKKGNKTYKTTDIQVLARGGQQSPAARTQQQQAAQTWQQQPAATQQAAPVNGNGNGHAPDQWQQQAAPAAPPAPAGVDPDVWARMDDGQRQQLLQVLGNVPAF